MRRKETAAGWLFASPVILGFLIFVLFPMVATGVISFTDYHPGTPMNFIGSDNYAKLFAGQDPFFFTAIRSTLYYVFLSVPLSVAFAYIVALLLNQKIVLRSFFRAIYYVPVVIPLAASSMVWVWMLQPNFGIFNAILKFVGLPPSQWLGSQTTVIPTLALFALWNTGSMTVIFLASLQQVPRQLYEALEVDGGNLMHKITKVTLPMTSSIIFFNTLVTFLNTLQTFVQPYMMTSGVGTGAQSPGTMGGPNGSSLTYALNLYREAFKFNNYGNAAAQSTLLFLFLIGFTFLFFRAARPMIYYEEGR
jgi:multiple sugar transport system permease protein